jgi:non-ribosomal peptide synthetase component F
LNEVVRVVGPKRVANENPLFQVMFSMHDSPTRNASIPDLTIELQEGLNNGAAKFDLNVIVIPPIHPHGSLVREGGSTSVTINWEYRTDVFDAETIARMSACYVEVLHEMTDAPARSLRELISSVRYHEASGRGEDEPVGSSGA